MNAYAHKTEVQTGVFPFTLKKNEILKLEGESFQFTRRYASGKVELRHLESDEIAIHKDTVLLQKWVERKLVFLSNRQDIPASVADKIDAPLFELRPSDQQAWERKLAYVSAYNAAPVSKCEKGLSPLIADVSASIDDKRPPHWKTLLTWLRDDRCAGGDTRVHVPGHRHKGGRGTPRMDIEVFSIIEKAIDEVLDSRHLLNQAAVVDRVTAEITRENASGYRPSPLQMPAPSTIYRHIMRRNKYIEMVAREGREKADAAFKPAMKGPSASRPGEVYEIDHHKLKIVLFDSQTGLILGRPWLTLALDRFTRAVVGYYLSLRSPNWHSIAMCLRHAIAPKLDIQDRFPHLQHDWPYFGLPEWIVVDNGRDFHSVSLKHACARLGISVHYAPRKRPQWKGKVERWFGTLIQRFALRLPGYVPRQGKKGTAHENIRYGFDLHVFERELVEYIVDEYSISPHRGIRSTPRQKWLESVVIHPVQLPRSSEDLNILLLSAAARKISQQGFHLHRIRYNGSVIANLRAKYRNDLHVEVRFDVNDLGAVYVIEPETHERLRVYAVDQEYARGLSLDLHRAILADADVNFRKHIDTRALAVHRDKKREEYRKLLNTKSMSARHKAKMLLDLQTRGLTGGRAKYTVNETESRLSALDTFIIETEAVDESLISSDDNDIVPIEPQVVRVRSHASQIKDTRPKNPPNAVDHIERRRKTTKLKPISTSVGSPPDVPPSLDQARFGPSAPPGFTGLRIVGLPKRPDGEVL